MLKVNVLILGKSGCGKSSLLNYLWGAKIADVAAGRPVTPEFEGESQGIYRHPPAPLDNLQLVIHDSWGMEANKAEKWQQLIKRESRKCDASRSISDWIHTVVYCVSAKGARIEDFEIDSIISPLIDEGNRVLFVLTKADIASEQEKQALREILARQVPRNSGIIEVSSLSQTLRSGQQTEEFGRDEMLSAIMSNLRQNLIEKIPAQLVLRARESSAAMRHDALTYYEKEAGFTRTYAGVLGEIGTLVEERSRCTSEDILEWLTQALRDAAATYGLVGVQLGPGHVAAGSGGKLSGEAFLTEEGIGWASYDYIANTLFHIVPGLNILFVFVKKGMHRDILTEKLDAGIERFIQEVNMAARGIRQRLGEVLALPAPVEASSEKGESSLCVEGCTGGAVRNVRSFG